MRISDWSSDVCSSDLFGRSDCGPGPSSQSRSNTERLELGDEIVARAGKDLPDIGDERTAAPGPALELEARFAGREIERGGLIHVGADRRDAVARVAPRHMREQPRSGGGAGEILRRRLGSDVERDPAPFDRARTAIGAVKPGDGAVRYDAADLGQVGMSATVLLGQRPATRLPRKGV